MCIEGIPRYTEATRCSKSLRFHRHLSFHRGHRPPQIPFVSTKFENLQDPRKQKKIGILDILASNASYHIEIGFVCATWIFAHPSVNSVSTNFCMTCAVLLFSSLLHAFYTIHDAPCLRSDLRRVAKPNGLTEKKQRRWNWSELVVFDVSSPSLSLKPRNLKAWL